jgi:hypothetical protein
MPKGEGIEKQNNSDIVYGVLVKMTRPIIITNANLRKILKTHRDLDLTESQLRTIFDKLKLELKITTLQEGIMTKVSILSDYDEMIFSQGSMAVKKHNTPQKAFDVQNYLKRMCVGYKHRISMQDLAHRFASSDQSQPAAERQIREIVSYTNKDRYMAENNHPFDFVIMSNSSNYGAGGYWIVASEDEAHQVAERSRAKAMTMWAEHWSIVRKLERHGQFRIKSSETQTAVFKAISDDLRVNPIMKEIEDKFINETDGGMNEN